MFWYANICSKIFLFILKVVSALKWDSFHSNLPVPTYACVSKVIFLYISTTVCIILKWTWLIIKSQIFHLYLTFFLWRLLRSEKLFFFKLVDTTQISKLLEATRHHHSTKLLVFLPLRADLLCTLHYETPCSMETKYLGYRFSSVKITAGCLGIWFEGIRLWIQQTKH